MLAMDAVLILGPGLLHISHPHIPASLALGFCPMEGEWPWTWSALCSVLARKPLVLTFILSLFSNWLIERDSD